jgi:hypothetical protein
MWSLFAPPPPRRPRDRTAPVWPGELLLQRSLDCDSLQRKLEASQTMAELMRYLQDGREAPPPALPLEDPPTLSREREWEVGKVGRRRWIGCQAVVRERALGRFGRTNTQTERPLEASDGWACPRHAPRRERWRGSARRTDALAWP